MQRYTMKVSRNGQISIPAGTRARWKATSVTVVDLGDHLVVRPITSEPIDRLSGKYAGRAPSTDILRSLERASDADRP